MNENRPGYKKTKVGWIPEEWKVEKLDTFVRIISGGTPSRSNLAYWKGTIPWISSSDLYEDDIFKIRIHKYITKKAIKDSATKLIPANSILVVSRVGVGKVAISIDAICTSQDFQSLILNTDTIEAQYLAYQIKIHTAELLKLNQGTSINGFLKSDLAKLPIPLPSLPEQKAIASVLECWDRAIHKYEEKMERKKSIKKGLMQRLLCGKQRLPGFSGEWKELRLDKVSTIYDGTHTTPEYVDKGISFYSVENITSNNFETKKFISSEVFKKECKRTKIEKGDILMTRIGDIGTSKYIDWDIHASFYVSLVLLKKTRDISFLFLNHYISYRAFQKELWRRTIHVAYPMKINLGEIGKCIVQLPPLPEQKAIASILSSADSEIKALEKKLDVMKEQKKYLLNNLVTGTIRLPEFRSDGGV